MPEADAVFWVATAPGTDLPVYRIDGPVGGPALLFGHANGMAAGSYEPWLRALAADATVFAFDSRGHGGAIWPDGAVAELFTLDHIADDLAAVARAVSARVGDAPLFYAGHSLNAVAALILAAQNRSPVWAGMMLFEPPVFPSPDEPSFAAAHTLQQQIIAAAERRRAVWPDPDAFFARLQGRGPFAKFDPAMLRAHCRATLRPKPPEPQGSFTLCCPPDVETRIYRATRETGLWRHLPDIAAPIHLVSGDSTLPDHDWVTGAMAALAARLPNASLSAVSETGHMMICERPDACRALLVQLLHRQPRWHASIA